MAYPKTKYRGRDAIPVKSLSDEKRLGLGWSDDPPRPPAVKPFPKWEYHAESGRFLFVRNEVADSELGAGWGDDLPPTEKPEPSLPPPDHEARQAAARIFRLAVRQTSNNKMRAQLARDFAADMRKRRDGVVSGDHPQEDQPK